MHCILYFVLNALVCCVNMNMHIMEFEYSYKFFSFSNVMRISFDLYLHTSIVTRDLVSTSCVHGMMYRL